MAPEPPKAKVTTGKKPKIVQIFPGKQGPLGGILYDNGRFFFYTYTKEPNAFDAKPAGEGYWTEVLSDIDAPVPPKKNNDTA